MFIISWDLTVRYFHANNKKAANSMGLAALHKNAQVKEGMG
jgi:hypothetical protein